VRFAFEQTVAVRPAQVVAAYGSPAFYEGRPTRDDIALLGVVNHEDTGPRVLIEVRYAFTGSVSAAVRRVIDQKKMSWVTRTVIYPAENRTSWEVLPDHYPDRLTSAGSHRFRAADGEGGTADATVTVVSVEGELKVHVPIVGRSVERVIADGLRAYVADEVADIPDVRRTP
jgi:hypothetical protein